MVLGSVANAHHSQIGAYDTTEVVVVDGVITRVRLTSPHSLFVVEIQSAATPARQIYVESHARPLLMRLGLTTEVLKVGRHVVVHGYPSKSRARTRLFATSLVFEDDVAFDLDIDRVLIPLAD